MRDKFGPWLPVFFCAALAVIVTVANVWAATSGGSDSAATGTFILFMPICFFFVGAYLTKLRKENCDLRQRLDALDVRCTP
jgi:F0F1-type ATP synthase assembly protein I